MISLATSRFPQGTRGIQLDSFARKHLWDDGVNYGHGTGHGVGFCLGVHERPHSISPSPGAGVSAVFEPGVLVSNEPAIYREGEYGIRTENLMLCYEYEETGFGKFLKFDTVSLCYIDKSLIDFSLLDESEINWLNAYHAEVYEKLSPFLEDREKEWLKDKTEPF
jgi:Xaa-Pro aminopeptidase